MAPSIRLYVVTAGQARDGKKPGCFCWNPCTLQKETGDFGDSRQPCLGSLGSVATGIKGLKPMLFAGFTQVGARPLCLVDTGLELFQLHFGVGRGNEPCGLGPLDSTT
jgi:hypothetical protein